MKAAKKNTDAKTVAAAAKRKAVQITGPARQRSVWTGVKRKGGVSPLQLHLPGLGGVIR